MSIDQLDMIDIISKGPEGDILLSISDHYDWTDEITHIRMLQDKLNSYLHFIKSGQVAEKYPQTPDQKPGIEAVFKFEPPDSVIPYLNKFKEGVEARELRFTWRVFKPASRYRFIILSATN